MTTRQQVYDAIDREREFHTPPKEKTGEYSLTNWMSEIGRNLNRARNAWVVDSSELTRERLVTTAATIIACLEQHGIPEPVCEHEWFMVGTEYNSKRGRYILVKCAGCSVYGAVYHPSTHEFRQAEDFSCLVSPGCYRTAHRWYEPDRVVIESRSKP